MAKKQPAPRSWIVLVKRTVYSEIVVNDCTEEQARASPYGHAVSENDTDQIEYHVISVKPNE